MAKFKLRNGWTKEKMINAVMAGNKGMVSANSNGICLYRSEINGEVNKCVAGCFIPDDKYHSGMEETSAFALFDEFPEVKDYFPLSQRGMDRLQHIHDKYTIRSILKGLDPRPELCQWIIDNVK